MILRVGFLDPRTTTHFREIFCPVLSRLKEGAGGVAFLGGVEFRVMDSRPEILQQKPSKKFKAKRAVSGPSDRAG